MEKPILFSAPMVEAILLGDKTQTRRTMKPQVERHHWENMPAGVDYRRKIKLYHTSDGYHARVNHSIVTGGNRKSDEPQWIRCPYGCPGDQLWVRETWRIIAWNPEEGTIKVEYKAGAVSSSLHLPDNCDNEDILERYVDQCVADCDKAGVTVNEDGHYYWERGNCPTRWRPSIHMPRWVSRILLDVKDVRVERLQDINEHDARAETAWPWIDGTEEWNYQKHGTGLLLFANTWSKINGPESWDTDPWVWVVEFEIAASEEKK